MSKLRQSFLEFIRTIGNYSGCHQLPERSFFCKGKQFPVCARCTGVFIGHSTAIILFLFRKVIGWKTACFLMAVMGIDWGLQEVKIKESTNARRLITGFLGGWGLYSIYLFIFRGIWQSIKITVMRHNQ